MKKVPVEEGRNLKCSFFLQLYVQSKYDIEQNHKFIRKNHSSFHKCGVPLDQFGKNKGCVY